ncbi:hypothetical protein EJB05_42280 [Eragrostis curvula]|uniref:Bifunctional inhibitor/plant lipid transfer protein/seed storage helical domain-containing protein n=1 Tax=Eragrostis curvula TaxID=38414 RepID=A0A5J9TBU7_9POAL|nr:hypothetical protein EJB05_42280 [Eragrostis curvula]
MARTCAEALSPLLLIVLLLLLGAPGGTTTRGAEAQACGAQLSGLASCARFSVPPSPGQPLPAPGQECCSALGAVTRDCACGALDIITSLPAKCGLPRVRCPMNAE